MERDPELIDTRELARMLSMSKKTIEKHRCNIVGAVKIAGCWRFHLPTIRARLATGRDIIAK